MERSAYDAMARTQSVHWWFVARRQILQAFIRRLKLGAAPRILEVGCGPGGNLPMLQSFGAVKGIEYDEAACRHARQVSSAVVEQGALPHRLPFEGERFDLICLLDVLEHLDDDVANLKALQQRAHAGTRLLVTVPAYQWLFSAHDRQHHHRRRYTARQLRAAAREAGWQVERCGYFNALLFPVAALKRLAARVIPRLDEADDTALPALPVNRALQAVFGLERFIVPSMTLPFGLSIIATLRPAATDQAGR